jgi:hypothetical protein
MADLKKFTIERSSDPSNPGFRIPGVKFRWISGRVRETSQTGDLWRVLKKSDLHADLVKHIQQYKPGAFSEGDTIRRGNGELILAYAPVEECIAHRKRLDALTKDQASRARITPKQEKIGPNDFTKLETYEGTEGSIPAQFLGNGKKPE